METSVMLVVYLSGLGAAIGTYSFWLRRRSGLAAAKVQIDKAIAAHGGSGTLNPQFLEAARIEVDGSGGEGQWKRLLFTGIAMVGGIVIPFALNQLLDPGVVLRTILCILCILPFVCLASIWIAQESAQIKANGYARKAIAQAHKEDQTASA